MKKVLVILACSTLLLSSCGTYTGSVAYVGGSFGSVLGSAIGGIAGGPRGSDIGTIVGMASGAIIGASVGNQADQQRANTKHNSNADSRKVQRETDVYSPSRHDDSGFDDTNSGDDRIYDFNGEDYTGDYSAKEPVKTMPSSRVDDLDIHHVTYSPSLEIVNARFVDANKDNQINRGETCKVIFEVMNRSSQPVYDVVPTVVEATGNKQIFISPNIHVEKIDAGKGIRYTAMIKAGSRLKNGEARFCVSVLHDGTAISKINEFVIPTTK